MQIISNDKIVGSNTVEGVKVLNSQPLGAQAKNKENN